MSCIFHHHQTRKVKCLKETEKEKKLEIYPLPSKSSVMNTALGCVGVPFQLGHHSGVYGEDIDADSISRINKVWNREKEKNQLFGQTFSNAFFGTGPYFPDSEIFNQSTNIFSDKKKIYKNECLSCIVEKSHIPHKFYYHFSNPQRINKMRIGFDIGQDTRMELRKVFPSNKK
jgi:hypothetical protein